MPTKTKEWEKIRKELKKDFYKRGITKCELNYEGCWRDNALSFAHLDKRRNVEDLREVVLACVPCHQKIEYIGRDNMRDILEKVIANRET